MQTMSTDGAMAISPIREKPPNLASAIQHKSFEIARRT